MKPLLTILLISISMLTGESPVPAGESPVPMGNTSRPIVEQQPERQHKPTSTSPLRLLHLKHRTTENVPTICNNPGAIRPGNPILDALAIGFYRTQGNGDFLVFDMPEHGFLALRTWIRDRYGWSIERAIYKFATPNQNNTEKYIMDLCNELNCSRSDTLCRENEMALMGVIAVIEGFKG